MKKYFLLISALVVVAFAAPATIIDSQNYNDKPTIIEVVRDDVNYRLGDDITPIKYVVKLEPFMEETDGEKRFSFEGSVDIYLKTDLPNINEIVLHSVGLDIDESKTTLSQTLAQNNIIAVSTPIADDVTQKLTFPLGQALVNFIEYKLSLTFTGKLSSEEDMHGFYRSSYVEDGETLYIATTQFQTTHARKAFPCFDEPKFKAIFEISLIVPLGYSAVSNMKIATSLEVGTKTQHTFKPTPILSTYLVAFIVSQLEVNWNEAGDFGVWARKQAITQTDYSVEIGPKLLNALNELLDFDYFGEMDMEKMEMAALPDFSAGAMENLGLLTYRETALLYDEIDSTDTARQRVATVITHEQAHMWFGDLVTCEWWSYTWLNEGFARYFQYFGTALVEDKWNLGEQFVVEQLQVVMVTDSQLSSHAMTVDVQSHSELSKAFDTISYNKGASVIRMMEHMIGSDKFLTAIRKYLRDNEFSTTNPIKLFKAIQEEATGIQIQDVLLPWTEQPGYPVINVDVATDRQSAKVTQKRFLITGETADNKWTIPLTYVNAEEDFAITVPKLYFPASAESVDIIDLNAADKWTIFNVQQTGYYRVMYDQISWNLIEAGLKSPNHDNIHVLNRAQILDDIFNFGRSGAMDYDKVFEILSYLTEEESYLPWFTALRNLELIERRMAGANLVVFKKYILNLIGNIYKKVTFSLLETDTQIDVYNRAQILSWACKFGLPDCLQKSEIRFLPLVEKDVPVPANIRASVYCTAIREGGIDEWEMLWDKFTIENVAAEQILILTSLGCSKNETIIKLYLDRIFVENSLVRSQDRSTAVAATYSQNPENINYVFDYIILKKETMSSIYGSKATVATLLATIAERFTSITELTKLNSYIIESRDFWETSVSILESGSTTAQANVEWGLLHVKSIIDYITYEDPKSYRLGDRVKPTRYVVKLEPFLEESDGEKQFSFEGSVEIYLKTELSNVFQITLHSVGLQIDHTKTTLTEVMKPENAIIVAEPFPYTETQKLVFTLAEMLTAEIEYKLTLTFTGELSLEDDMEGFYRSSYQEDGETLYIATTQFQTTHARKAFPCFDEPKFKAVFQITLVAPNDYSAVSNMYTEEVLPLPDSNKSEHIFKDTPIVSSYLIAFIISKLEVNRIEDGTFGVWARKDAFNQTEYSKKVGPLLLEALNTWMDFDYFTEIGMEKMEMAALPDFSAGAMENLGLLTYRETTVLYDENDSTDSARQRVASVIAHEQAHMWFGDLVTMEWWSYTWLNEGFARYFHYFGTALVEDKWNIPEQFVVEQVQTVMVTDSRTDTHAMTIDVEAHYDLDKAFDSISYNKGASVIRMMEHMIGTNTFKTALQKYLRLHKFETTNPDKLFTAIQAEVGPSLDIKEIMLPWTEQAGYPVINVVFAADRQSAKVTQQRYFMENNSDMTRWTIPLTYAKLGDDFSNTETKVLFEDTVGILDITIDAADKWVIFNVQEIGFYRVMYDEDSWNLIKDGLNEDDHDNIHPLNRAQIVDDTLNFGRSGAMKYDEILNILLYLTGEENYLPWMSALTNFAVIEQRLDTESYAKFKKHVIFLLENIYKKLDFDKLDKDTQLDVYNRAQILSWACKYGNEDCITKAKAKFEEYRADETPVPVNIRAPVYCTAIREGGKDEWDALWDKFVVENVAAEQVLILTSLGCSANESIINEFLDLIFADDSKVRSQDRSAAVLTTYTQNPGNIDILYNYIVESKEAMASSYGSISSVATLLSRIAERFTTEEQINKLKVYLSATSTYWGDSVSIIQSGIDAAAENLAWSQKYVPVIVKFVDDYHGASVQNTISFSLIAVAAIFTLFFK